MPYLVRIAGIAFMILPGLCASAQSSGKTAPQKAQSSEIAGDIYVPTLLYDVVSVHEVKLTPGAPIIMMARAPLGRSTLRLTCNNIENLLAIAYGARQDQLSGLPSWPWPTLFTVEAQGDAAADAKLASLSKAQQRIEQQHMMQALLADRFKLKAHWETHEGTTYALVVAKPGRLQESKGDPPTAEELKQFGDHPIPPLYQRNDGRANDYVAHGASMQQLAAELTFQMRTTVDDKTGLTGKYDFVLKYMRNTQLDRAPDDPDPTPPLDRAIQEQLGLKLQNERGAVQRLVIDHIEKPSEN